MHISAPGSVMGIASAIAAGVMCGVFVLPMRYLGRWSWENVWTIFILISCVALPVVAARSTAPQFLRVIEDSSGHAGTAACAAGFLWGFGAIMFGQAVSAIGVSMSNTLMLAISASLGSFLPIAILAPARLRQPQGHAITLGTSIGVAGIAICGYAGFLREKSQRKNSAALRGAMVGHARPFGTGLLLCVGAGLLSAVLNIGYSLAQPLLTSAVRLGYSPFAGSNVIWLMMLTSGAVPNLCFCGYLLAKNGSWVRFTSPNAALLYSLAGSMGLLWAGDIFLYGFASPRIGALGPAIGWPLKLIAGLIAANVAGYLAGEWKHTRKRDRQWMIFGIAVLLAAIAILSWASTLD